MIFRYVIVTAHEHPGDEALVRLVTVEEPSDLALGLGQVVEEWRRMYPGRDLVQEGCTLLIEDAMLPLGGGPG